MPRRQTAPRPDVAAFDYATRAPFAFVAKELVDILGAKLVAYIAGVREGCSSTRMRAGARAILASSPVFDWHCGSQR